MDELHAKGPDETPAPASNFAERMALAKAAKKAKPPEAEEGATQLPEERQKLKPKFKPRKNKLKRKSSIQKLVTLQKSKKLAVEELGGINPTDCPVACKPDCCVITGENVCGHPAKGGLQAKYLEVPAAMSRFNQARAELARIMAEKQKTKTI